MLGVFVLVFGLLSVLFTVNALRRPSEPSHRLPAIWLFAMLTSELAPLVVAIRVAVVVAAVALGALHDRRGSIGVWLILASILLALPLFVRTHAAVAQAGPGGPLPARGIRERFGWVIDLPESLEVVEGVAYAPGLTLDVYRARTHHTDPAPTFVYVHGGSWTGGDPHRQSRALFHHLAESGWKVVTIRYPLSPDATFPDHIVGVKRAVAYLKGDGGAHLGVDPARIVLSGGSAGAHLAALAALTVGVFQPGFEEVDTSVTGCVTFYGIYDFLIRHGTRVDWALIHDVVMKSNPTEDPDRYRMASPIDHVGPHAPPFLVVHGTHDSLVPPREAEVFVEALRDVSQSTVEDVFVIGGQHGFDAISSPRTRAVGRVVADFANRCVDAAAGEPNARRSSEARRRPAI